VSRGAIRIFHALALALLCAVVTLPTTSPTTAGDAGSSFKDAGEGLKKFGRKVGEGGKEAGHAIADAAKKIWYKGKRVSQPLLRDVQKATRKFWDKVIEGKDKSIEALKSENASLRGKLGEKGE
jgi:hypothetical protein